MTSAYWACMTGSAASLYGGTPTDHHAAPFAAAEWLAAVAGDHAEVAVDTPPYGRMLPGIRGLRLHVISVTAKFKYDDHNPLDHRARVADHLADRAQGRDLGAADQQRRRLARVGIWRQARDGGTETTRTG